METEQTVTGPVCGMKVDPEHAAGSSEHAGHTYHFCSAGCKTRFDAEPKVFAAAAAAPCGWTSFATRRRGAARR